LSPEAEADANGIRPVPDWVPPLATLLGALFGGTAMGPGGFFFGALLGLGIALLWQQRRAITRLERVVAGLHTGGAEGPSERAGGPDAQAPIAVTPTPEPIATPAPAVAAGAVAIAEPAAGDWPAEPRAPSAVGTLARRLAEFFTTGNVVVRLGVVVLFLGVAFLLRYAYEHALLPVELRLAGAALGGLALTAIGWRLRERADSYGVVLQGAGVGVLYLTVFAAARLYPLLPIGAAFAALVILVAASSVLAVVQRAQSLAAFATSGGFLAPVLLSTGEGSHVALFSYYAVLNAGVLAMAWFRAWRWLNWLGFLFTFVIGASWGYQYYRPELYASTQPFLVLFFGFYLAVTVLFARRDEEAPAPFVDGALVFGMPLAAFALQWALVRELPFGLAYSALTAAFVYLTLAWWLKRQARFATLLGTSFTALAVIFATLAIPFAFDDQRWTAGIWALEGAGLIWFGVRQQSLLSRLAGLALQAGAGFAFLVEYRVRIDPVPLVNGDCLGAVLIGIAALHSAWLLGTVESRVTRCERAVRWLVIAWGLGWWTFAGLLEIDRFGDRRADPYAVDNLLDHLRLGFAALTAVLLTLAAWRLRWRDALSAGLLLLPLALLALLTLDLDWRRASPLAELGWLAWPAALAALYAHLAARDAIGPSAGLGAALTRSWHAGAWWFAALLLAWMAAAALWAAPLGAGWTEAVWGAVPLLLAVLMARVSRTAPMWPFRTHPGAYGRWGPGTLLGALVIWSLLTGQLRGDPAPLPYLAVINPLELTQLGVLAAAALAVHRHVRESASAAWLALGVAAFLWVNLGIARAVHHYAGVDYPLDSIVAADAFQTSASIVWTLIALTLMGLAARRAQRPVWIAGACVLALAVVKLFLVDLAQLDTAARIVSFISVGALMLLIGYLAPLPPARPATAEDQHP
jgi:uncharacterized membrane protein